MEPMIKEMLSIRLAECIVQLKQAQKALLKDEFTHAAIYVGNAQYNLQAIRTPLARG